MEPVVPTIADVLSLRILEFIRAPTATSWLIAGAWMLWVAVLTHLVPGHYVPGLPLRDGSRLIYKLNGLRVFIISLVAAYVASYRLHLFAPTILYEHFSPLFTTSLFVTLIVTVGLHVRAKIIGTAESSSGNLLMDLWLGNELNPRIFGLDMKTYGLRVAMMGWTMVNLSVAAKQYEVLGTITTPMIGVQLTSFIYVFDYFYNEPLMLSTWDIIAENWGGMLIFGDFTFIPLTFSFQPFFVLHDPEISPIFKYAAVVAFVVGYYIFRMANLQKDQFKKDPNVLIWGKKSETVGRLLVSGFWGIVRKPNYTGDLLVALSFSLPTGGNYFFAYFYPLYLFLLLLHRQARDDRKCAEKYGKVWREYTRRVPYVLVPGLY